MIMLQVTETVRDRQPYGNNRRCPTAARRVVLLLGGRTPVRPAAWPLASRHEPRAQQLARVLVDLEGEPLHADGEAALPDSPQ